MAHGKRWIVTLADGSALADARRRLADAGFDVDQVLNEIGVVTGRCDDKVAAKLRKIEAVEDVSPEGEVGIGPPDADLW
jgi:hypothetical protein